MKIIVDTCVWSRFLRQGGSVVEPVCAEVLRIVRADVLQMLGPIRQELLAGAAPKDRFVKLQEYLRFFPNLPLTEEDDENAASYYNQCRNQGIQGSSTDLLICAVSVRHGTKIFTSDMDFERYAECLPIRLHWPVRRAGAERRG